MVESFTNVDGAPSILRIETTGEAQKITVPPFVNILREVTDDKHYNTVTMANLSYKMPEQDKIQIQLSIHQSELKMPQSNNQEKKN